MLYAFLLASGLLTASSGALADVSVSVNGNVATANVALPSVADPQYTATVTITFDAVTNLSADSLGLTADIVSLPLAGLPTGVNVDPNFPVVISVEPTVAVYRSGFETGESGDGNLSFTNSYEIEIHSDEHLSCSSTTSNYRLFKAPHGSDSFADVTDALYTGSVRSRGRGGAFSRFVIVHDTRNFTLPIVPGLTLPAALLEKIAALTTAILTPGIISNPQIVTDLLAFVTQITVDLVALDIAGAIDSLNQLIAEVVANAGTQITNVWSADSPTTVNGAGQILSAADTLLFTLDLLNGSATCTPPP